MKVRTAEVRSRKSVPDLMSLEAKTSVRRGTCQKNVRSPASYSVVGMSDPPHAAVILRAGRTPLARKPIPPVRALADLPGQ